MWMHNGSENIAWNNKIIATTLGTPWIAVRCMYSYKDPIRTDPSLLCCPPLHGNLCIHFHYSACAKATPLHRAWLEVLSYNFQRKQLTSIYRAANYVYQLCAHIKKSHFSREFIVVIHSKRELYIVCLACVSLCMYARHVVCCAHVRMLKLLFEWMDEWARSMSMYPV